MERRGRTAPALGLILASVVVSVVLAGCGGDDDGSPPPATAPTGLTACVAPAGSADQQACLDQIEGYIENDIAGVENAVQTVNDVLSGVSDASYEFERVTPVPEGDGALTSTDPIELHWRVGGTERTMFVCFPGGQSQPVEVGTTPCPN
jgi:hypothetical protein